MPLFFPAFSSLSFFLALFIALPHELHVHKSFNRCGCNEEKNKPMLKPELCGDTVMPLVRLTIWSCATKSI
jgi:hypothetical protein